MLRMQPAQGEGTGEEWGRMMCHRREEPGARTVDRCMVVIGLPEGVAHTLRTRHKGSDEQSISDERGLTTHEMEKPR